MEQCDNGSGRKNKACASAVLASAFESLGIPSNHASVGLSNLIATSSIFRSLFCNRRLPDMGLSDVQIQSLLFALSSCDSNNAAQSRRCGVGEREGRVYSSLVANRHFGFSHGVGRSGDITEPQPKAVGSSALAKLTLHLTLDAVRRGSGLDKNAAAANGILLPMCTGMSIALTLQSMRQKYASKDVVLWCRIDQKSCYKAIYAAGLTCEVVSTERVGDEVRTSLDDLQKCIARLGRDRILAVITTTSCFAPRVPDRVDEVAKVCSREEIAHIINHAYGLQCTETCRLINRACVVGRVDAIVCSTDKNFMVPVGGAIVLSPDRNIIENIGKMYAGRASASPCIDLFITLLSMGMDGYKSILTNRLRLLPKFKQLLSGVASNYGERLLDCPSNTISFAVTLSSTPICRSFPSRGTDDCDQVPEIDPNVEKNEASQLSYLGSMLFSRCVSGARVVPRRQNKTIGKHHFLGYGSSTDSYEESYFTAACAIGLTEAEIEEFASRLDKALKIFLVKRKK